jgi:hypothetical protein
MPEFPAKERNGRDKQGTKFIGMKKNGRRMERGADYRTGKIRTLEGQDLVVWLQLHAEGPVSFRLLRKK